MRKSLMGRGGFPPSETGSFSAHHTAQWVGLFSLVQVLGARSQEKLDDAFPDLAFPDAQDLTPATSLLC